MVCILYNDSNKMYQVNKSILYSLSIDKYSKLRNTPAREKKVLWQMQNS